MYFIADQKKQAGLLTRTNDTMDQRGALGFTEEGHGGPDKNSRGAVRGQGSDEWLQGTVEKELVEDKYGQWLLEMSNWKNRRKPQREPPLCLLRKNRQDVDNSSTQGRDVSMMKEDRTD